jgi:RNA polymerase sigma factor (TIGR02999 family)
MSQSETTVLLKALSAGDQKGVDRLMELVYGELRQIARRYMARERVAHTLEPTALVNEAFMKLIGQDRVDWQNRSHFMAVASQSMRRILVDHARSRNREKRGGGRPQIIMDDALTLVPGRDADVLAVDEALEKLAELDATQAKIVEMRFFGGMSVEEVAEALDMPKRSVERQWTKTRAWLRRELEG